MGTGGEYLSLRDKKIIVGFGTGRCGSYSLARLLDLQKDATVSHEAGPMGWYPILARWKMYMNFWRSIQARIIGDVSFVWINYLDRLLEEQPHAKAIWLYRDPEEVIESFWAYKKPTMVIDGEERVVFSGALYFNYPWLSKKPTKDAIAETIELYLHLCTEAWRRFPLHIHKMKTDDLNHEDKLVEMLDFVGIPRDDQIVTVLHENKIRVQLEHSREVEELIGRVRKWQESRLRKDALEEGRLIQDPCVERIPMFNPACNKVGNIKGMELSDKELFKKLQDEESSKRPEEDVDS